MKKTISIVGALISILILTSCSSLQSPYVIGEPAEYTEDEIGNETVWKVDDEIYHVRIVSTNSVAATVVKWDKKANAHKAETTNLILSELDNHLFINLKEDKSYFICRVVASSNDSLVFYSVDEDEIKRHIHSGKVELGETEGVYLLKGTKEEIDQFVLENIKVIFDTGTPVVADLLSGELK